MKKMEPNFILFQVTMQAIDSLKDNLTFYIIFTILFSEYFL